MNKLRRTSLIQVIFFTVTFLLASLVGNFILFRSLDTKAVVVADLKVQVSILEQAVIELKDHTAKKQQRQLSDVSEQQQQLKQIIQVLKQQLQELSAEQTQTNQTALQTAKQLSESIVQVAQLKKDRILNRSQLTEAQKTIENQQRLIRATSQNLSDTVNSDLQAQLSILRNELGERAKLLSFRLTATGEAIIDIPLSLIFEPGNLTFTGSAPKLFAPIAKMISASEFSEVWVIGHSDARPIVSDLALLYPSNWELSSVRASKVVQMLISQGVSNEGLTAAGIAANNPIGLEDNEESWQLNRRLEIKVKP